MNTSIASKNSVRAVRGTAFLLLSALACGATRAATVVVRPGTNLPAVIASARAGDTVLFEPGVYRTQCINVSRRLRLEARQPGTVTLLGKDVAPRFANDDPNGVASCALNVAVGADFSVIRGLHFKYFRNAVYVKGVEGLKVTSNVFESNYGNGLALRDTRDVEVYDNAFLDPYLPQDDAAAFEPYAQHPGGVTDAQMDYGISIYGSIRPRVHHNYFFGVFNQALSFKIANRDAYAGYNTFEGFNLTALFFGQEPEIDDTYPVFGGAGVDSGTMVAEGNVFRAVQALRADGTMAPYRARTPLRIKAIDGVALIRDNIVETSIGGIYIECGARGCPQGAIELRRNLINGRVDTPDGEEHRVGDCGVAIDANTPAAVLIDQNTTSYVRSGVCIGNGAADVGLFNNEFFRSIQAPVRASAPPTGDYNNAFPVIAPMGPNDTAKDPRFVGPLDMRVRQPAISYSPSRAFARGYHLTPASPGLQSGQNGVHRGAFSLLPAGAYSDGFERP